MKSCLTLHFSRNLTLRPWYSYQYVQRHIAYPPDASSGAVRPLASEETLSISQPPILMALTNFDILIQL